ncbi:transcription factor [Tanacetum coccineum]|uniref:Transcription factor n=1 Tax=Tanacetum coccineum TaxID=301880 RepID=A0ABQ5GC33_9ASTR
MQAYCRHLLNAVSIEHSILRLLYRLKSSCAKSPERNETEIRNKFRLEWSEPLVTFALCSGIWSSHVVRVYTATQVENEIATTKREYLQAAFGIMKTCKLIGWKQAVTCLEKRGSDTSYKGERFCIGSKR